MLPAPLARLLSDAAAHHRAGRFPAAAEGYARVLAQQPGNFEALQASGDLAFQQGKYAEAATRLTAALRVQPKAVPCLVRLGLCRRALGQPGEAEQILRQALAFQPDHVDALQGLGSILTTTGRVADAIKCFERVTALRPNHAGAWLQLGTLHLQSARPVEALACQDRALAVDPAHPQARFHRAQALQALHRPDEALADYEAHLARQPGHLLAQSFRLLLLNYRADLTPAQLWAEHLKFGRSVPVPAATPVVPPAAAPVPARRLRVGFLSPDFRRHAVAYFIEPLLAQLDPARFDVVLYHDHFTVDPVTLRLKTLAAAWRHVIGRPDDAVETIIRQDHLDVLVDLAGHTGFNRLPLFARRLAPAQVTYLGYPNTTGLAAMDYRFTDAIADPEGESDLLHTEKLVRFAPTAWAYQPPTEAAEPAPPPSSRGQPFTFGSFNNLSKLNDATLLLWRDVLAAAPGSRLLLKSLFLDATAVQGRLARLGFDPARVLVEEPKTQVADHLAAYGRLDVALDPFPYNGTTTTCEALWLGVPVLTLAGDRHAARVSASLLTAVGHPEWIAPTREEFIARAAQFAAAPAQLVPLRQRLRADFAASPLLAHAAQAARFGDALLACWQARTPTSGRTPSVP